MRGCGATIPAVAAADRRAAADAGVPVLRGPCGHCFDIARSGYVNLLQPQDSALAGPGRRGRGRRGAPAAARCRRRHRPAGGALCGDRRPRAAARGSHARHRLGRGFPPRRSRRAVRPAKRPGSTCRRARSISPPGATPACSGWSPTPTAGSPSPTGRSIWSSRSPRAAAPPSARACSPPAGTSWSPSPPRTTCRSCARRFSAAPPARTGWRSSSRSTPAHFKLVGHREARERRAFRRSQLEDLLVCHLPRRPGRAARAREQDSTASRSP